MTSRIVNGERKYPFAKDENGVWHVRRDWFWDNDISADIRAHAICGDIWSCEVSAMAPILIGTYKPRHCRGCFPLGRAPRRAGSGATK